MSRWDCRDVPWGLRGPRCVGFVSDSWHGICELGLPEQPRYSARRDRGLKETRGIFACQLLHEGRGRQNAFATPCVVESAEVIGSSFSAIILAADTHVLRCNCPAKGEALITVIIPVLNGSPTVAAVVEFACRAPGVAEVLVVDDGSIDGTPELAAEDRARVVTSALLGKEASMHDGMWAARNEILLYLDGNLSGLADDLVQRMTAPLLQGRTDFVKSRFSRAAGRVTMGDPFHFSAVGAPLVTQMPHHWHRPRSQSANASVCLRASLAFLPHDRHTPATTLRPTELTQRFTRDRKAFQCRHVVGVMGQNLIEPSDGRLKRTTR